MLKTIFIIGFALITSSIHSQSFSTIERIIDIMEKGKGNYYVMPQIVNLGSYKQVNTDSCNIQILYKIINEKVISHKIPRIRCYCSSGKEETFNDDLTTTNIEYPKKIKNLIKYIDSHVKSPVILTNSKQSNNYANLYLGKLKINFKSP